jgi:hypothetical protein
MVWWLASKVMYRDGLGVKDSKVMYRDGLVAR